MKPFDGGQWVGVTRIGSPDELHRRYDESGERLMHLQAAVEDFDVFARSLSIGAETMTMRFEPDRPMHDRYHVDHAFLSPENGEEVVTISRLVNSFFGWEFNSCETIVKDGVVSPIDYANASPDVSLISLHYYFPWAITALAKWSAFCVVTGARCASRSTSTRTGPLATGRICPTRKRSRRTGAWPDEYFEVDAYREFCDGPLAGFEERAAEWFAGPEMDAVLVERSRRRFPAHEHEQMVAHYRGLLAAWAGDRAAARPARDPHRFDEIAQRRRLRALVALSH